MKRDYKLLIIAVGIGIAGTASGYALGGYATGGGNDSVAADNWWGSEASAEDGTANMVASAPAPSDGPEHYVCKGCGPTLAERRNSGAEMRGYPLPETDFGTDDPAPTPTPAVHDGSTAVALPALDGSGAH